MGTSSAAAKILRPKVKALGADACCAVCGITKPLETAHIIPLELLSLIAPHVDKALLVDYDSHNVMVLCANHHTLYDRGQLDRDDFSLIWSRVFSANALLMYFLTALLRKQVQLDEAFFIRLANFHSTFESYGQRD